MKKKVIEFHKSEEGTDLLEKRLQKIESDLNAVMIRLGMREATLSPDQRRKAYVLIRKIADHTGYDEKEMKSILKDTFAMNNNISSNFSLANCSKNLARQFIDYLALTALNNGTGITEKDLMFYEKTSYFMRKMYEKRKCCICGQDARAGKYNGRIFSVCEIHQGEFEISPKDFIEKYILSDYFNGQLHN